MKKEHMHDWMPAWDLGHGRYRCACGETGYRYRGGKITQHKTRARPDPDRHERVIYGGAVGPLPTLDVYDRAPRD